MTLYTFLHNLLNVLVQVADKMGLHKKICDVKISKYCRVTVISQLIQVKNYLFWQYFLLSVNVFRHSQSFAASQLTSVIQIAHWLSSQTSSLACTTDFPVGCGVLI
jgi:hypothetical protein